MLGVSWGAMVRPVCSCIGTCICQARLRQANLQDSLDSLGVEWGLRVRPRARTPQRRVRPPLGDEEPPRYESSSSEVVTEEEAPDPLRAFDDILISDALAAQMCFRERLEVAESAGGSTLGLVTVGVGRSRTRGHLHVRVAGSARLPCAEVPANGPATLCSTSVVGCVDYRTQRTADERRHERCEEEGKATEEKFLYMAQDEGNPQGHYFNITARQRVGDFEDRRSQEVPFEDVANLISEALTVVLLRFVGLTGFEGTLHLQAVLPNGALVPCDFEAEAPKIRVVYGHEVKCSAVTQFSADARGSPMTLRSLVSSETGQLLRHAPVVGSAAGPVGAGGGGLVLRAPHRHPPAPRADLLERPEPLAHGWEDDLQAQGMLRDKKEELMVRFRSLLTDRPEVRWLLANYVQAALLSRPSDGLWLARQHFAMPTPVPRARGFRAAVKDTPYFRDWDPWSSSIPSDDYYPPDSGGAWPAEEETSESLAPFLDALILAPIFDRVSLPPSPRTPLDSPRTTREIVDYSVAAALAAATDIGASESSQPYTKWKGMRVCPTFDAHSEESRVSEMRRQQAYGSEGDETSLSLPVPGTGGDVPTQVRLQRAAEDYFNRPPEEPWGHDHVMDEQVEPVPWPSQPWHAEPVPVSYDPSTQQQAWTEVPQAEQQYEPYPQPQGDFLQRGHEPRRPYEYEPQGQPYEQGLPQEVEHPGDYSTDPQVAEMPEHWQFPQEQFPEYRPPETGPPGDWANEQSQQ